MDQASEMLLGEGRRVRIKSEIIHYPDRYEDKDGKEMFDTIMRLLVEAEGRQGWRGQGVRGCQGSRDGGCQCLRARWSEGLRV